MKKLDKSFLALTRKIDKMERMGSKTIEKNYKKILTDLKTSMAKLYENYEVDGQLTLDEMVKYNRIGKLEKQVQSLVSDLYVINGKVIRGTLRGVVASTYAGSVDIVNGATGKRLKGIMKPFDVTRVINNDMAGLHWSTRQGKHRADVIYEIQKEVRGGLKGGNTYKQMADRLEKTLEVSKGKAKQIIRTESHRVMGEAKQQSFQDIAKGGVKFNKKWLSLYDERVRGAHSWLDGTVIQQGEDFISPNGGVGYGPGQMNEASDDINCRCVLILVLSEEADEKLEKRS